MVFVLVQVLVDFFFTKSVAINKIWFNQFSAKGARISETRHCLTNALHQYILSDKLVYNGGGFSNFELSLLVPNSTYVTQVLRGLSYEI